MHGGQGAEEASFVEEAREAFSSEAMPQDQWDGEKQMMICLFQSDKLEMWVFLVWHQEAVLWKYYYIEMLFCFIKLCE